MAKSLPRIAVTGASGLIGHAVAIDLLRRGFPVIGIARRFTAAQKNALLSNAIEWPIVNLDADELARRFSEMNVDVILNCVGVLQDSGRGRTNEAHRGFIERLLTAMAALPRSALLLHVSIPGEADQDRTPFSRTKREAERLIQTSGHPFVILRPGFVVAPAAYGGSALMRALAALPISLPASEAEAPFAVTDIADIAETVATTAQRWARGNHDWAATWDVMERHPSTVGGVIEAVRRHFGGPETLLCFPPWLLTGGAKTGDFVARLGWAPPIRTTALQELRRGVSGDPGPWIAETGIKPRSLSVALDAVPSTVQERWFARLYLLKPLILASLVVFWVASGLIALTVAFALAREILTSHGFPGPLATAVTVLSSLTDIAVGVGIAFRRTCKLGLFAGIAVSLSYMAGAAIFTPDLWIEPLGALVKTGPAIVLMGVAATILEDR